MVIIVFLLMFVLFLSIISIIFGLTGRFLLFETVLNIILLIAALKLLISLNSGKRNVWPRLLLFFSLNLINLLVLYKVIGLSELVLPAAMTMLGFVISLSKLRECDECMEDDVVESHEPGKYVASKTGKKFHVLDCNQVKKIKEDKKVFFDSEEDAKKKGKTACKCVKK